MNNNPLIFNIVRGSFDDGPGIRTTVYLKGCSLLCDWCPNSMAQLPHSEIAWVEDACINCKSCIVACPHSAISESYRINYCNCSLCGKCVDVCNYDALRFVGVYYTPSKLVNILLKDKVFYASSDGGVTFAGGDALMHSEYLGEVCKELKKDDIHIAVQTCGNFNFDVFAQSAQPYIDLIYFDLRIVDPEKYFIYARESNQLIMENLRKLTSEKKQTIIVRTPLIPGVTDTSENLESIDALIQELDIDGYQTINSNSSAHKEILF